MGMPALVVRWCRQPTVGPASLPVWLALELGPVAGSALGPIDLGALLQELPIAGIEQLYGHRPLRENDVGRYRKYDYAGPKPHREFIRHRFTLAWAAQAGIP